MFPPAVHFRSAGLIVALAAMLAPVIGGEITTRPSDALPPGAIARFGTLRLRHANKINASAFSPDGKLLASASGEDGGHDNTIRLWDVTTGEQRLCLAGHPSSV